MEHPEERFYLKLAETLGGMTRNEMLSRITSDEIIDWMAEFKIRTFEQKQEMEKRKRQASVRMARRGRLR